MPFGRCGRRFTTYERVQIAPLTVVKKDGRREEFSREKILAGIRRSCAKLRISSDQIVAIVDDVETALHSRGVQEVPSSEVGDMVMERLRELDHVAYVRFASHYRNFLSFEELQAEFERLSTTPRRPVRRAGAAQPPLLPLTEVGQPNSRAISGTPRIGGQGADSGPAERAPTPIAERRRRTAGGRA